MANKTERDYANMTVAEIVDTVIKDSKAQGTVTMPLRLEGYHSCSNVMYSSYAK